MDTREVTLKKPLHEDMEVDSTDLYQVVTVTLESFVLTVGSVEQKRWRPIKVVGGVEERPEARAFGELIPIACMWDEKAKREGIPAPFAAGGHLIADVLSGPNAPENLVPVSDKTNNEMTLTEAKIRDAIGGRLRLSNPKTDVTKPEQHEGTFVLTVNVKYDYDDKDKRIPSRFDYSLDVTETINSEVTDSEERASLMKDRKRTRSVTSDTLKVFDPSRAKKIRANIGSWQVTQTWMTINDPASAKKHAKFAAYMDTLRAEMNATKWKVENHFRDAHELSQAMEEVPPELRKYAVLDYFFLVKRGHGYAKDNAEGKYVELAKGYMPEVGRGFEKWQKDMMLKLMYAKESGFIKSDAFGQKPGPGIPVQEPYSNLFFGAAGNGPEFDHILPAAKGGCNLFSNCQITSGAFNSRKSSQF